MKALDSGLVSVYEVFIGLGTSRLFKFEGIWIHASASYSNSFVYFILLRTDFRATLKNLIIKHFLLIVQRRVTGGDQMKQFCSIFTPCLSYLSPNTPPVPSSGQNSPESAVSSLSPPRK